MSQLVIKMEMWQEEYVPRDIAYFSKEELTNLSYRQHGNYLTEAFTTFLYEMD